MKMLIMVFRMSLEEDILRLLGELGITAFTEVPEVLGKGDTGTVFHSFTQPGHNSMILIALEEERAEHVIQGLTAFRDGISQTRHGAKIPIRAFMLPCTQVI